MESSAEEKKTNEMVTIFTSAEEFTRKVDEVISSLKSRQPFSLGLKLTRNNNPNMSADVIWRLIPREDWTLWSFTELELALNVLVCRLQTAANVVETQLNLTYSLLGNASDEEQARVWKLMSKLNNLTYLNISSNKLKVISPLVCDLIHLQHLGLSNNCITPEGMIGVCELLKVCCVVLCLGKHDDD